MSKNSKNKSAKNDSSFFGGMNYKQFKEAGKRSLEMNDIAWAGRLQSKYPFWFRKISQIIMVLLLMSVCCLAVIWGSIFMRTPALLLGVYPEGQVVCFPRLVNARGESSNLHKSYHRQCGILNDRSKMMWQTDEKNLNAVSDQSAIGNMSIQQEYKTVDQVLSEMNQQPTPIQNPLLQVPDAGSQAGVPSYNPSQQVSAPVQYPTTGGTQL